jgi:hypothetical protein
MTLALLSMVACANLTSCSNDDDNNSTNDNGNTLVNPGNVFSGTRLQKYNGGTLKYDASGLLTDLVGDENNYYKLSYDGATVKITGKTVEDGESLTTSYTLTIGADGFVKHLEGVDGKQQDVCDYTYDADGYLTKIVDHCSPAPGYESTDGGTFAMYTLLKWEDGKLIATYSSSQEFSDINTPGIDVQTFEYTNEETPNPIENKGGVMTFDDTFGMNAYGLCVIFPYYGGMMGKGWKYLPLKSIPNGHTPDDYAWTLDENGYTTSLVISNKDYSGVVDNYTFGWK